MNRVSRGVDRVGVTFDDPGLVANTGLLLVATLSARLGIADLADRLICLAGRVGGARPGRKVLTLVHAMVAGGSHIDHADVLRAGSTGRVLGHRVIAPSTLGSFLRSHLRACPPARSRGWSGDGTSLASGCGAGRPAAGGRCRFDYLPGGRQEETGRRCYTRVLGYHPILASRG